MCPQTNWWLSDTLGWSNLLFCTTGSFIMFSHGHSRPQGPPTPVAPRGWERAWTTPHQLKISLGNLKCRELVWNERAFVTQCFPYHKKRMMHPEKNWKRWCAPRLFCPFANPFSDYDLRSSVDTGSQNMSSYSSVKRQVFFLFSPSVQKDVMKTWSRRNIGIHRGYRTQFFEYLHHKN